MTGSSLVGTVTGSSLVGTVTGSSLVGTVLNNRGVLIGIFGHTWDVDKVCASFMSVKL